MLDERISSRKIQKKINFLAQKYKNKKIVLYGAGKLADFLFEKCDFSKLNIVAIADKKFESGDIEVYNAYKTIVPRDLETIDYDLILLLNENYKKFILIIENIIINSKNSKKDLYAIMQPSKTELLKSLLFSKQNHKTPDTYPNGHFYSPVPSFSEIKTFKKHKWSDLKNINLNLGNQEKLISMQKYIFTFWEPREDLPAYLNLCMATWKKFLPEYKIINLNYSTLQDWLPKNYYDSSLFKNFSLPKQADAIRCALLKEYGGIWFDNDTIITSDKIREIINRQNADVTIFDKHIAFIVAKKNAKFLRKWNRGIKIKIHHYKFYKKYPILHELFLGTRHCVTYDFATFLGNSIINKIIEKNKSKKEFQSLSIKDFFTMPELMLYQNMKINKADNYREFYFGKKNYTDMILEREQGLILLHNSWTPPEYKQMSEEEFLNTNTTISTLLKKILE